MNFSSVYAGVLYIICSYVKRNEKMKRNIA